MIMRLFQKLTNDECRIPIFEVSVEGYEPQEVDADMKSGFLEILSDVDFGPASDTWQVQGFDIYNDGNLFAWGSLDLPIVTEKGDILRIPAGTKYKIVD